MNLTEWARAQGIHVTTAYWWYREGQLPVPARKVGRLILVSHEAAAGPSRQGGAGLYARVSCHDQKADLDRQVARLSAWAAQAGLPVVRVEAEVGSGMKGARAGARRPLADPAQAGPDGVVVVPVGRRDHPHQRGPVAARRTEPARPEVGLARPYRHDRGPACRPGRRHARPGTRVRHCC